MGDPSSSVYSQDKRSALERMMKYSSSLTHDLRIILENLEEGTEIHMEGGSIHVRALVFKLNEVCQKSPEAQLSKEEIFRSLKSSANLFNLPYRVFIICTLEIIKVSNTTPDVTSIKRCFKDVVYLQSMGCAEDFWIYFSGFMDVITHKIRHSESKQYIMQMANLLIHLGFNSKMGTFIINKFQDIFNSYLYYLNKVVQWNEPMVPSTAEVLMAVVQTIIGILEKSWNTNDLAEKEELQATYSLLEQLRKVTSNTVYIADIEYCLSLFPF